VGRGRPRWSGSADGQHLGRYDLANRLLQTGRQWKQRLHEVLDRADAISRAFGADPFFVPRTLSVLDQKLHRELVHLLKDRVPLAQEGTLQQQRHRNEHTLVGVQEAFACVAQPVIEDVDSVVGESGLDFVPLRLVKTVVEHFIGGGDPMGDIGHPEMVVHVTGKAQRVPAREAVPVGQPFTGLRSVDAAPVVTPPVVAASGA
jgi:hypothetical protein